MPDHLGGDQRKVKPEEDTEDKIIGIIYNNQKKINPSFFHF